MSWGISPNATEKEKLFCEFSDGLNGMNSAGELSYRHYSEIWDMGRKLADAEYEQGRKDMQEFVESKCKDCAGCTLWKCDCTNERNRAIDDFEERLFHKIKSEIDDCADELEWIEQIAKQIRI